MNKELKPCPFCGGDVQGQYWDDGDCWITEYYTIRCNNEGCHAYDVVVQVECEYNYKKDKKDKIEMARATAKDNAILLWNTRVQEEHLNYEIDRAKEAK